MRIWKSIGLSAICLMGVLGLAILVTSADYQTTALGESTGDIVPDTNSQYDIGKADLMISFNSVVDHNDCENVSFHSSAGKEAIIKCSNGVLEFSGDMNCMINMIYDYVSKESVGFHTKPVIFKETQE